MFWILLACYVFGFFVVLSKKMEIRMTTRPATFGEKLFCATIWPLLAIWIVLHIISGHCKVKRTK
jgi:membrane associated rhomboid family serine protease